MKNKKVIKASLLPTKIPLGLGLLLYLFLDNINASSLAWGIVFTLYGLTLISCIIARFQEKEVDILEDNARGK